jgi:hypothetical protein
MDWKTLSRINRCAVIADVLSWKNEESEGSVTDEELEAYRNTLDKLTDAQLAKRWYGTVGDWLSSRPDIRDVNEQFRLLQNGQQSYGYA